MDSSTSGSLHKTERFHHTSTNSMIPQPQQEIYSLHRCIGWCLQSSVNTRTWRHRISNHLLIPYFFRNPKEVEHNWTRGLWSLLCCHQMELLSARCRYHSQKWSQATHQILNGKNANNKVNRWGLQLATYNITFEWISGPKNKAVDCLSCLVELPQTISAPINMLSVSNTDGPTFNTRSWTHHHLTTDTSPAQPSITPEVSPAPHPTPKSLMTDRLEALLQMQKTDPFCKQISKCLSNGKAPQHQTDLYTHVRGLQYKHMTDSGQKFLALVIPKSWKYTVLVETHDKLGHQGNTHTYCLIKHQYYWKGMNKDIRKYIANCSICHREKTKFKITHLRWWRFTTDHLTKLQ